MGAARDLTEENAQRNKIPFRWSALAGLVWSALAGKFFPSQNYLRSPGNFMRKAETRTVRPEKACSHFSPRWAWRFLNYRCQL